MSAALSPRTVLGVEIDLRSPATCRVTDPDHHFRWPSQQGPQRTARARLTGWKIDIRLRALLRGPPPRNNLSPRRQEEDGMRNGVFPAHVARLRRAQAKRELIRWSKAPRARSRSTPPAASRARRQSVPFARVTEKARKDRRLRAGVLLPDPRRVYDAMEEEKKRSDG